MIQRYTCVPTSEYDVLVVTNGTVSQVELKLITINEKTNNEIPLNSNFTYLEDFPELLRTLKDKFGKVAKAQESGSSDDRFRGKVVFMFFNGVEYIQSLLSDLIDYSASAKHWLLVANAYFYFDSLILFTPKTTPSDMVNDLFLFNTIVSIANDVLKKSSFMTERIRGLFIDDIQLAGEKVYPLHLLMRNFPHVERIELTSFAAVLMTDMVL